MSGSYTAVVPGKLKLKKLESGPSKSIVKKKKKRKESMEPVSNSSDKDKVIEKTSNAVDEREKKKSDRYCK